VIRRTGEQTASSFSAGNVATSIWNRALQSLARLRQNLQCGRVRQLRVLETLALGEKRQLLIVECGEKQLLIGTAGNFLIKLDELPAQESAEGENA